MEGVSGYVAAIEWRSVHELRPRTSTSGGQSGGGVGGFSDFSVAFVWDAQEAKDVQDRQLQK